MKKLTLLLTTSALIAVGTYAYAQSSTGASFADTWVTQLEAEGYTQIEVEVEDGEIEIEGVLNGMEREIRLDEATGTVLSDEIEAEDEDENNEEGEDDEDDA